MEKIKIDRVVVVEGKYDKIRLSALIDGVILETEGFGIFKNKEKMAQLRDMARRFGLLVLTDSDAAGFNIRGYLNGCIPPEQIRHAYIPDILGKERRKKTASAEGKLGVEGMSTEILRRALEDAGVLEEGSTAPSSEPITLSDLYEDGIVGGEASREKRLRLLASYGLPGRLSTSALLKVLQRITTRQEYKERVSTL